MITDRIPDEIRTIWNKYTSKTDVVNIFYSSGPDDPVTYIYDSERNEIDLKGGRNSVNIALDILKGTTEFEKVDDPNCVDEIIQRMYKSFAPHLGLPPENASPADPVLHPSHYAESEIECIDAIKASMTSDEFAGYCKGNIEKYVWRYGAKNGVEDLEKAKVYLTWLINTLKGEKLTK